MGFKYQQLAPGKFRLEGDIDETLKTRALPPAEGEEVILDMSGITRINSLGTRLFINYIKTIKGVPIFQKCSTPVVDTISLLPAFIGKRGRVESVLTPFTCNSCEAITEKEFKVGKEIVEGEIPDLSCDAPRCHECGGSTNFEEEADIFFHFLLRQHKEKNVS